MTAIHVFGRPNTKRFNIDINPYPLAPLDGDKYHAFDNDTYDGAEDSAVRNHIGYGPTKARALRDLIQIFLEHPKSYDSYTILAAAVLLHELETEK